MRKLLEKVFGDESSRTLKQLRPTVDAINALEPDMQALSDDACREKIQEFRVRLASGESIDSILPEAFALVREASRRTLGMRHYDVQMIGGLVLHRGSIAEMRTGEGKTLVATLPVSLNALVGKGVHVITVNDYLARRDGAWMGAIYHFLGLSLSILNDMNRSYIYDPLFTKDEAGPQGYEFLRPVSRKDAYLADITYGTNAQFGFDYLRDNTQYTEAGVVQRGHAYAIVDEVDSVLIDEARVPLILSTMAEDAGELYKLSAGVAEKLIVETDYTVDEKMRAIQLTDTGIEHAEQLLGIDNLYTPQHVRMIHHLETAVRAKALFRMDQEYVIRNGEVIIVDPFTGRMQEGRRYSDGLHQAIEAKEGVEIKQESKTMASITYQNYFKFYTKLSGMTGTAKTSAEEFQKVYGLGVVEIPTHRPTQRLDHIDLIFQTEAGKFKAVAARVKELHERGQPVLIGTVSIEKNELLSLHLRNEGIPHQMLNAKNHDSEANIIAEAGKRGSVVIATNMAGRGVDIKLGGHDAPPEEQEAIRQLGGLYVIGTERHEARRIDNQLRGRSGRQGDPGETQFYVCLDDPLMRVFGGDRVKNMIGALGMPEDQPIQNGFISRSLEQAQSKIEGFHFDSRKNILSFDDVLSHHRNLIYGKRNQLLRGDREYLDTTLDEVTGRLSDSETIFAAKKIELGDDIWYATVRRVALYTMDRLWMDHLELMDYARQSVNLRAYGQREPIVEYKRESLRLFRELEQNFAQSMVDILSHVEVPASMTPDEIAPAPNANLQHIPEGKHQRNEKIIVMKNGEEKEIKFKKLKEFIDDGWILKA